MKLLKKIKVSDEFKMSKTYQISIMIIWAALLLQNGCSQQAVLKKAQADFDQPEPKITFANSVLDFGKVGPGQQLVGQFKITNTGEGPLKITEVEKCCGVVATLDKEEIAPGESVNLEIRYTSGQVASLFSRRLYVNSNDNTMPRAELTIKAETILKIAYEPKSLQLYLKEQNAGCPQITIKSTENKLFSITGFKSTGDCLTADIDPAIEATEFVIQPKADMGKLAKTLRGGISIGLDFSQPGTSPEIDTVDIVFQAISQYTVIPSMLVMLYDKPAEPIKKILTITNNYEEDFEIESASSKDGHIKILSQEKNENKYMLELEITPEPVSETGRFSDTLTIQLRGGQSLEVTCSGIQNNRITRAGSIN